MVRKLKIMRAAVSAAVLMMALAASSSAQAVTTRLTFTEHDTNGQTYVGGFDVENLPTTVQQFSDAYYASLFELSNFTGIFHIPASQSTYNPFANETRSIIFVTTNAPFVPFGIAAQTYAFSDILNAGTNFKESGAVILAADPGFYGENGFIHGTYNLDATQFSGQIFGEHYDSLGNLLNSSSVIFSPISATLRVGPAAPAPLAGAGLLSALAALAALAMTRLFGRNGQLA